MVSVDASFHTLIINPDTKTRIRMYFISDSVDCTDDNDVQTNGVLLKADPADTDSNALIDSSSGLSITEAFNKDTEYGVGSAASYTISCSFLNLNDALSGFDFGKCKIYLDAYDSVNEVWVPCPLGVFFFEVPVKRRVRIISATGYDQMSLLETIADTWWNGLDWPGGLTIENIIQLLVGTLGIHLNANALTNIVNGSLSFTEAPFKSVERTYRDILQFIAEATGTIAVFDRDGALNFRWFSEAQIGGTTVEINVDSPNTTCLSIDAAEYTVPAIDQLVVKASDLDVGAAVGSGDNQYAIMNNPFMGGPDEATITAKATPIYNRISALGAYSPVSLKLVADCSIEAGDIISVVYQGLTYTLPIFQQTLTWRGGYVSSTPQSSGNKKRQTQTAPKREEFRSKTQMHEFEVSLERLLSRIESIDGNFTQIEQTVNAITQTVYSEDNGLVKEITDILNPDGEIWSAITRNETDINGLTNTVDSQRSYIRFLPAEPAIVLGMDDANAVKLKLVNNVIYFFNGADDSTNLSNAYAYFNSEEANAKRFVASDSVQAGNWKWQQLTNGHFVLDYVG